MMRRLAVLVLFLGLVACAGGGTRAAASDSVRAPSRAISGQTRATTSTTRIVPMPPSTTEPVGPMSCATAPDSKPPNSFEPPIDYKQVAPEEIKGQLDAVFKVAMSVVGQLMKQ